MSANALLSWWAEKKARPDARPARKGAILLATALLLLSGAIVAAAPVLAAEGSAHSSAVASNTAPGIGDSIVVTVVIDVSDVAAPDNALGSFTGNLGWNPAVLAYRSDSGVQAGFTGLVNTSAQAAGHLRFNGANAVGTTGRVTVFTASFDVIGAGSSDLRLEYSAMAAAATFASLLPLLTVTDGQVAAGAVTYNLTVVADPPAGGQTNPPAGSQAYASGAIVEVTAIASTPFRFDHWSGACTGAGACSVTMNAEKTVVAHFTQLQVTCHGLTLNHTGEGSDPTADPANSTGCPLGLYAEGETISLSGAVPGAGWRISGWTGTARDGSTDAINSLVMPASAHAATVIYQTTIETPTPFGGSPDGVSDTAFAPIGGREAPTASAPNAHTEPADSAPPATPAPQTSPAPDARGPAASPTAAAGNQVVDVGRADPPSGASEATPAVVPGQPGAAARPLILDRDGANVSGPPSGAQNSPVQGHLTAAWRRSRLPLQALLIVAVAALAAAVVALIAALRLFRRSSGNRE